MIKELFLLKPEAPRLRAPNLRCCCMCGLACVLAAMASDTVKAATVKTYFQKDCILYDYKWMYR